MEFHELTDAPWAFISDGAATASGTSRKRNPEGKSSFLRSKSVSGGEE